MQTFMSLKKLTFFKDEFPDGHKYGRGGAPGLATYLRIGSNLEIL